MGPGIEAKLPFVFRSVLGRSTAMATQVTIARAGRIWCGRCRARLFEEGAEATHIALVGSGHVRLVRTAPGGLARVIGYRSRGEVAGEAAFGGEPAHGETVEAMGDVQALVVPLAAVVERLAADPAVHEAVCRTLVARHQAAEKRLEEFLRRASVPERVASFLLMAAERWGIPERGGVRICMWLGHQEIASVAGAKRETVTEELGRLRRAGIIEMHRRQMVILRPEALVVTPDVAHPPPGNHPTSARLPAAV